MKDLDPCVLLRRCLAGRRAGDWQEFVNRHGKEVRRSVRQTAGRCGLPLTEAELDEMVQDFYCRLLTVRGRRFGGRTEEELWRYLFRVAQSLVVDRMRHLGAQKRWPCKRERLAEPPDIRSLKLDPEERFLKRERRKVFLSRCLEVVRCDRVALELKALALALLEGWPSREIAEELQGALSSARVDRLVSLLRQRLRKDGICIPRRNAMRSPVPALV